MADLQKQIRLYGLVPGSIVDGPGIRFAVFMQGCVHHCPGCHNPKSQAHRGGKLMTVKDIVKQISSSQSSAGVTLSGGEPFDQAEAVAELAEALKDRGHNLWCYTGYLFEDLVDVVNKKPGEGQSKYCNVKHSDAVKKLLLNLDVLVDGPFELAKKSYAAQYCGSTNQRLIDVQKSLENHDFVFWKDSFELPQRPSS